MIYVLGFWASTSPLSLKLVYFLFNFLYFADDIQILSFLKLCSPFKHNPISPFLEMNSKPDHFFIPLFVVPGT